MKRAICIILAALMIATLLVACRQDATPPAPATPTPAPVATPAPTPVEAIPPQNLGVEIPTLPLAEPLHLTAIAQRGDWSPDKEFNDLDFWAIVEEGTNIFVDFRGYTAGEAINTALSLMHASGDYPDFILGATSRDAEERFGVVEGVFTPLNDFITPEIMPNFYELIMSDPSFIRQITATDGFIYATPRVWDLGYDTAGHFFINNILLEQTGLDLPTTLDEFEAMLRAFRELGPEIIPFEFFGHNDNDLARGINNLTALWGQVDHPSGLVLSGTEVIFSRITPEFRMMLEWVSRLYNDGLIAADVFAQDDEMSNAKVASGNVGSMLNLRLQNMPFERPLDDLFGSVMDVFTVIPPFPALPGVDPVWRAESPGLITGNVVVTKANQHVLETMLWVDFQMDPLIGIQSRNGIIGRSQEFDDDGFLVSVWDADNPATHDSRPGGNGVFFLTRDIINSLIILPPFNLERYPYIDMYRPFHTELAPNLIDMGRLPAAYIDRRVHLRHDIDRFIQEEMYRFIREGVTDTAWDDYVNTLWTRLHLQEYLDIAQMSFNIFYGQN